MKLGVIIGRFQTPYLHEGHLHLINTAKNENHRTLVLVGTKQIEDSTDNRNPYSFDERVTIIRKDFPDSLISKLIDMPDSDELWSKNVDEIIETYMDIEGFDEAKLYHSRDSFKDYYSGKFETVEVSEISNISATQIRESMKKPLDVIVNITKTESSFDDAKIQITKLKRDVRE